MKRTRLFLAAAAAAVVALAACGSTEGTPTAASDQTTGNQSTAQQTDVADDAAEEDSVTETGIDEDGETGAAESTGDEADGTDADAKTTVGSGDLDAQSAAWFSTVCTGMTPMAEMAKTIFGAVMAAGFGGASDEANAPDPQQIQQAMVAALNKASDSFSDTAEKLKSTPPPTFEHGDEIAAAYQKMLGEAGPKLRQVADQLSKEKITDMESFGTAMEKLGSMEGVLGDLGNDDLLNNYDLAPETTQAIENLPACKAMQDAFGDFQIGGGSQPTG